jgi:hypothetical protein
MLVGVQATPLYVDAMRANRFMTGTLWVLFILSALNLAYTANKFGVLAAELERYAYLEPTDLIGWYNDTKVDL